MTATLPKISIVTPNFQQGAFIGRTLSSVLDQNYPALEYIVMDGGSKDDSVDVIESFADRLEHWQSAPDKGQYDAITNGLNRTTGEVMGWLNSDDIYLPWTLQTVGEIFRDCPDVMWLTCQVQPQIDVHGVWTGAGWLSGVSRASYLDGRHMGAGPRNAGYLQQESTFWRRSLWEGAGAQVGANSPTAGDFELWGDFFLQAEAACLSQPLAAFRSRPDQRSKALAESYHAESLVALDRLRREACHRSSAGRAFADSIYAVTRRRPGALTEMVGYTGQFLEKGDNGWMIVSRRFL